MRCINFPDNIVVTAYTGYDIFSWFTVYEPI